MTKTEREEIEYVIEILEERDMPGAAIFEAKQRLCDLIDSEEQ